MAIIITHNKEVIVDVLALGRKAISVSMLIIHRVYEVKLKVNLRISYEL